MLKRSLITLALSACMALPTWASLRADVDAFFEAQRTMETLNAQYDTLEETLSAKEQTRLLAQRDRDNAQADLDKAAARVDELNDLQTRSPEFDFGPQILQASNLRREAQIALNEKQAAFDQADTDYEKAKSTLAAAEAENANSVAALERVRQRLIAARVEQEIQQLSAPVEVTGRASKSCENMFPKDCYDAARLEAEKDAAKKATGVSIEAITELENNELTREQIVSAVSANLTRVSETNREYNEQFNSYMVEVKATAVPALTGEAEKQVRNGIAVEIAALHYSKGYPAWVDGVVTQSTSVTTTSTPATTPTTDLPVDQDLERDAFIARAKSAVTRGEHFIPTTKSAWLNLNRAAAIRSGDDIEQLRASTVEDYIANVQIRKAQGVAQSELAQELELVLSVLVAGTDAYNRIQNLASGFRTNTTVTTADPVEVMPTDSLTELMRNYEKAMRNKAYFTPKGANAYFYALQMWQQDDSRANERRLAEVTDAFIDDVEAKNNPNGFYLGQYEIAMDQARYNSSEYLDLKKAYDRMQREIDGVAKDREKEQKRKARLDKWYVTPL